MMIKRFLGIAPKKTEDGSFSPSSLALKLATSSKTDYDHTEYNPKPFKKEWKIMMVCTKEKNMGMANGTTFSTGNHPVEMLVPMLHFRKAGFTVDIFTPSGEPAKIEMWAFPEKDKEVQNIYSDYQVKFDKPKSLKDFVNLHMLNSDEYLAVFIPGGHGALLGLPNNIDLKKLIHWSAESDLLMLSICHGPAALLAANIGEKEDDFIYRGYKMSVFPDKVDQQTPLIGYMPGQLTWKFGEKLRKLGVDIINKKADDSCHRDRNLVTGASPKAANSFGKLATEALLDKVLEKQK